MAFYDPNSILARSTYEYEWRLRTVIRRGCIAFILASAVTDAIVFWYFLGGK